MFKKFSRKLALIFATLLLLTACGQSTDPGSTPEETAKALIAAFEASDTAALSKLYTAETIEALAAAGFSLDDLLVQTTKMYGAPLKDQGRVLQSAQSSDGKYARVEFAIAYDGKCSPCSTPDNEQPDWAPQGSKVVISEGALRKESDGKWLGHTAAPGVPTFKEQRAAAAQATSNAAVAPTRTAEAIAYQAVRTAEILNRQSTATAQTEMRHETATASEAMLQATSEAWAVSLQATQEVEKATQTAYALAEAATRTARAVSATQTQAAIPTATPTTAPLYQTAKTAFVAAGVAAVGSAWAGDATLIRVWDQVDYSGWPFDYDQRRLSRDESYVDGKGSSRQWLFVYVSIGKRQLMVVRVIDGKLARKDVSAAMYRDWFGDKAIAPVAVSLDTYLDSDQALSIARENGFRSDGPFDVFVHINTAPWNYRDFNASGPVWTIFGAGKGIFLNVETGEVVYNGF